MRAFTSCISCLLLYITLVAAESDILLIHGQGVDPKEFEVMRDFAARNVPLSVKGISLQDALLSATTTNKLKDAVAILQIVDKSAYAATNSSSERVYAILDLKAIREEYRISEKSSEEFKTNSYTRELMKEIGVLLGLKKGCLNPHCCMSEYQKEGILVLGRNYCPVCLGVIEAKYADQIFGAIKVSE